VSKAEEDVLNVAALASLFAPKAQLKAVQAKANATLW